VKRAGTFLALLGLVLGSSIQPAHAVNYTVTYLANASQFQQGVTTGAVPSTGSYAAGTLVTASANIGNLARQGFTFNGWNTLANGLGDHYAAGTQSFNIGANVTFYAEWTIPASARLIGITGTLKTISNTGIANGTYCLGGIRGITSDGSSVYFRAGAAGGAGYLCKASMTGALQQVFNIGGALATLSVDSLALTYGNGCVYVRPNGAASTSLYCIDLSDSSITSINLPSGQGLYVGQGWLQGNLITFPDGRVGAVSAPKQSLPTGTGAGQCPSGLYCKVLRLYTLNGTGKATTFTFSEDIVLADNSATGWPDDDHGIATDGTYLYQINFGSGYKVYALASGSPSYLVYNAVDGSTCTAASPSFCSINTPNTGLTLSNGTYIGRNHSTSQYLMGDYSNAQFWVSDSATPPPGPGFPTPTVSAPSFSGNLYKGIASTISITTNLAGVVRFFVGGKRISSCKDRTTTGTYPNFTVSCSWKPPVTGKQVLTALLTPLSNAYSPLLSAGASVWVLKRTTTR